MGSGVDAQGATVPPKQENFFRPPLLGSLLLSPALITTEWPASLRNATYSRSKYHYLVKMLWGVA